MISEQYAAELGRQVDELEAENEELRNESKRLRQLLAEVIEVADAWCLSASGGEVIDRAANYLKGKVNG